MDFNIESRSTQMPCGVILSKNTDITDAHGWDFSRIGYSCASKGKSVETEHVMFTFALAGRGMALRFTQGVASLALGYGGHWAFSPLRLTGMNRASHILGMRKIRLRSTGPEGHQKRKN